jgi:hypothetical protein
MLYIQISSKETVGSWYAIKMRLKTKHTVMQQNKAPSGKDCLTGAPEIANNGGLGGKQTLEWL